MSALPVWLQIFSVIFGGVCVVAGAAAVIWSRYRRQTDVEREKYISALEERNKFLEADSIRRDKEQKDTERSLYELQGKVHTLQEMILRQCRHAEIDPVTGGCRNCALGMAYGQGGN